MSAASKLAWCVFRSWTFRIIQMMADSVNVCGPEFCTNVVAIWPESSGQPVGLDLRSSLERFARVMCVGHDAT